MQFQTFVSKIINVMEQEIFCAEIKLFHSSMYNLKLIKEILKLEAKSTTLL